MPQRAMRVTCVRVTCVGVTGVRVTGVRVTGMVFGTQDVVPPLASVPAGPI